MASVAAVTPKRSIKAYRSKPKVSDHPTETHSEHKIMNRHRITDDYFGSVETSRTGSSFHSARATNNNSRGLIKQKSSTTTSNTKHPSVAVPEITLLPSPSGSWSTVSSPGSDHEVWDSPETPSLRPIQQLGVDAVTPLTPPTAYELSSDDTPSRKASRPSIVSKVKGPSIFDRLASRIPDQDNTEDIECQHPDENSFQPKKLFRGFTDSLKAISEDTAKTAAQLNYTLQSSYTFTFNQDEPVSSRTRSNIKHENGVQGGEAKATTRADKNVVETKPIVSSQTRTPPTGLQLDLEQILPTEIHQRLRNDANKCIASYTTIPGSCTYRSVLGRPLDFDDILKDISTCNKGHKYNMLFEHTEKLLQAVTCRTHHISAQARIIKVKSRLPKLLSGSPYELSIFNTWVEGISVPKLLLKPEKTTTPTQQASAKSVTCASSNLQDKSTPPSKASITASVSTVAPPTSKRLVSYQPKRIQGLSPFDATWSKINEPLNTTDEKDGYIYIFWDKENFGMVKIGRTKDLEKRLKQWQTQCKRPYTYHRPSDGGEVIEIPHVSRVERLIHLELKDCRKRHLCEGCGKVHGEWFEKNEPQAVKVVRKWQKWILQKPYAYDPSSGEWRIRPDMMHTLAEVCKPVLEDVMLLKTSPRKDGTRRKSKRKSFRPTK